MPLNKEIKPNKNQKRRRSEDQSQLGQNTTKIWKNQMGQWTRKLITMQKASQSERWHWQIVCVKKKGRRGLANIESCIDVLIQGLEEFIEKTKTNINYSG